MTITDFRRPLTRMRAVPNFTREAREAGLIRLAGRYITGPVPVETDTTALLAMFASDLHDPDRAIDLFASYVSEVERYAACKAEEPEYRGVSLDMCREDRDACLRFLVDGGNDCYRGQR